MLLIVIVVALIQSTSQLTANPTWFDSPNICSGIHRPVNYISGGNQNSGTYNATQTFSCSIIFSAPPRVILGLKGYFHKDTGNNDIIGFFYNITNIGTTGFSGVYRIYQTQMKFLHYMYMAFYSTTSHFYTSYQSLTFSSGPLVNTTLLPRTQTQTFTNPNGWIFPYYYEMTSHIFLVGFRMNTGTYGTYINIESNLVSSTQHTVTIKTTANVIIMQVTYFRLLYNEFQFNRTNIIVDNFYISGSNNLQLPIQTTLNQQTGEFMPDNFMMGLNFIDLQSISVQADIMFNFTSNQNFSQQVIYTTKILINDLRNSTFRFLNASVFHHRIRECGPVTPYYFEYYYYTAFSLNLSQLCYDICPTGSYRYSVNYCEACHYSCLTCFNYSNANCSSCSTWQFRIFNFTTKTCLCQPGYVDMYERICRPCTSTCLTCAFNQTYCTSCNETIQHRVLNTTNITNTNTCTCATGYYQNFPGSPLICMPCSSICMTCINTASFCTSCNATQNRVLSPFSNTCVPQVGYYENVTSFNRQVCLPCYLACLTCTMSSTFCTSCNTSSLRYLNSASNNCLCINGYYQTFFACAPCNSNCVTCSLSATYCTSCNLTLYRVLNPITFNCTCMQGYFQVIGSMIPRCQACSPTCLTCQFSSINCLTCNTIQNKYLNLTTNTCECLTSFYSITSVYPPMCGPCDPNCLACQLNPTDCTLCNSTLNLTLNQTTSTCVCLIGVYDANIGNCQPCQTPGCLTCQRTANSNQICTKCDTSRGFNQNPNIFMMPMCYCPLNHYLQISNQLCQTCQRTCSACYNSLSCSMCYPNSNREINLNISYFCTCITGHYDNGINQVCQQCDLKCLSCTNSASNCSTCNLTTRNFVLVGSSGNCECIAGTIESNLNYGQCIAFGGTSICGNGIVQHGEQCDDFGIEDRDGCSSTCKIEEFHTCDFYSNRNGTSLCWYNKQLIMSIQSVVRLLDSNKVGIIIKISAFYCNLAKLKNYLDTITGLQLRSHNRLLQQNIYQLDHLRLLAANIIYISSANFEVTDEAKYQGNLNILLDYTEPVQSLANKQIKFLNSNNEGFSQKYFFDTPKSLVILEDPYNKVAMKPYSNQTYQFANFISFSFLGIVGLSLLYFIVMVFVGKSVIPIQNILVVQFAYFCIVAQKQVELAFTSLAFYGRFSIGFNINILKTSYKDSTTYFACKVMTIIYQQCNSIDNINITFCLATLLFISIFLFCCQSAKYKQHKQITQKSQKQLQDYPTHKKDTNQQQPSIVQDKQNTDQNKDRNYLPNIICKIVSICREFTVGLYFMTAIQLALTVFNVNDQYRFVSYIWLGVIGVCFLCLWIYFFSSYPIKDLSFVQVLKPIKSRLAFRKYFYVIVFIFLLVWGSTISLLPGIASYSLLIVFSAIWIVLTLCFQLYHTKANRIRATINQTITILIALVYILLEYLQNDGYGLYYAIVVMVLLVLNLINNVFFYIYGLKKVKSQQIITQYEEQFKDTSPLKFLGDSSRNIPTKRQFLMENAELQQMTKIKTKQLKNVRDQLKMKAGNNSKQRNIFQLMDVTLQDNTLGGSMNIQEL